MNEQAASFEAWCLVELFGHSRIAGKCTEQNIAGTNLLRVDVPETKNHQQFTKFFNHAAIYAITPVDEDTCKYMAESISAAPLATWDIKNVIKSLPAGAADDDYESGY